MVILKVGCLRCRAPSSCSPASVRTRSVEQEVDNVRDLIYIAGEPFRKISLEGTIFANNHRNEQIVLVILRRFSGELVSADREPEISLLEEGAGYVNKRNQLTCSLTLEPGEEVKLVYRYTLLVRQQGTAARGS